MLPLATRKCLLFPDIASKGSTVSTWQHLRVKQGINNSDSDWYWKYLSWFCVAGEKPMHQFAQYWIHQPSAQMMTTACMISPLSPPSSRRATSRPAHVKTVWGCKKKNGRKGSSAALYTWKIKQKAEWYTLQIVREGYSTCEVNYIV